MSKKRRVKGSEKDQGTGPTWMITFSDLCTLMLTFFVLILSMSSLNKAAYRASFRNFDRSVDVFLSKEPKQTLSERDLAIEELCRSLDAVLEASVKDADQLKEKEVLDADFALVAASEKTIWIRKPQGRDGFSLILGESLLFESGSARLNLQAQPILTVMGDFLRDSAYRVYIDGHTDDDPLRGELFKDNDELSIARAKEVLKFFLTPCNVPFDRLAFGGYGSSHPLADNTTPAGKALNRRVELIFERMS